MKRVIRRLLLTVSLVSGSAYADTLVLATTPAGLVPDETVTWGQLGTDGAVIPNPFTATSSKATTIVGSFSTTSGLVAQVGGPSGWTANGDFAPNDYLVWSFDNGSSNGTGPVTFNLPVAGYGIGAAIEADSLGQFTAEIQLYNGNTLLGSESETSDASGDSIFIGALDVSGRDVTKAVFSLTVGTNINNETNYLGDFALDTLYLKAVPEPGSFLLLGGTLLGFGWKLRRKATCA